MKEKKRHGRRVTAFLLSVVTVLTTIFSSGLPVLAADGMIQFNSGEPIYYGDYLTTKMTFDGDNMAYCVEPLKKTPQAGTYSYNLLPTDSPVRKALYYLPGGYGYDANIKDQYLSGWSEDNAYVIGHLTVAYIYSGYDAGSGAFYGAPQDYIDKAIEVTNAINALPNPPQSFRAFIVPSNNDQTIAGSWYQKPYGYIEIRKSTANEGISGGNGNYSLAGAEYGVFKGETQVTTLVTDENGYAKSGELEVLESGSYTIRELKASPGFAIDTQSYNVTVESDTTVSVEVTEIPQSNPLSLLVQKIDAETGEGTAQGNASLAGAAFTVKYYTVQSDSDPAASGTEPERTWIFRTDEAGRIEFTSEYLVSGDEFYYQMDGTTPCVPLGTVTVQETKAPEGYLLNESVFVQKIVAGGTQETVECYQTATVADQVYRGDLEFVKVSDGDLNRLTDVPFSITSKTTGESHVIVTDRNGYASTSADWTPHTSNTNRGETSSDGIWFGTDEPDNTKGALPYDTYVIEEQRCEANEGMNLLKIEVTVYRDSVTIDLGTLTDDRIEIGTTALDKETGTHLSNPDKEVTLIDTVEYEGLKKGEEYRLIGTLMDQETGETILVDGEKVTAETTFTAKKSSGSVEVKFTLNGSALQGTTVVVFEELYQGDLKLAVHADLEDKDQTIYFPKVGTKVADTETGEQIANAGKEVKLTDTVSYENLVAGEKYRLTGTLIDQETGEPILVDGKEVTGETEFTAEESSGTAEVVFTFDGSTLAGKTIVVFEKLWYEDEQIGSHEDLDSKDQTLVFPAIETEAKNPATDSQVGTAEQETTILDTVTYHNLIPGKEYTLRGVLMDQETGEEFLVNGEPVTSEVVFTPSEPDGSVEMTFTFDGSALTGKTLVVFEDVYYKEKTVASHAEIESDPQSIYYPEIGTQAKDGEDGDQEAKADKEVTIIDTVSYKNLTPGLTYQVSGILMDKTTGVELLINGEAVNGQTEFVPENAEGTVDVTFTFNAEGLVGKEVVVFEKLYLMLDGKAIPVTSHEDISDQGQTVKLVEEETPKTPETPETPTTNPPQTGDTTSPVLWIAIALLSAAGIGCGSWKIRRRKRREDKV